MIKAEQANEKRPLIVITRNKNHNGLSLRQENIFEDSSSSLFFLSTTTSSTTVFGGSLALPFPILTLEIVMNEMRKLKM